MKKNESEDSQDEQDEQQYFRTMVVVCASSYIIGWKINLNLDEHNEDRKYTTPHTTVVCPVLPVSPMFDHVQGDSNRFTLVRDFCTL